MKATSGICLITQTQPLIESVVASLRHCVAFRINSLRNFPGDMPNMF
jgi:hypothetical protein